MIDSDVIELNYNEIYDLLISVNDDELEVSIKGSQLYDYLNWLDRLPISNDVVQQWSYSVMIYNKWYIISSYDDTRIIIIR